MAPILLDCETERVVVVVVWANIICSVRIQYVGGFSLGGYLVRLKLSWYERGLCDDVRSGWL